MSDNNKKRTEISELGEFKLIDHLTKNIELKNTSSIFGVGDDAAVIDAKGKQVVLTTDILIEGIHFDLMYTPLKHLGYKAVTVNISDIYAMNANPKQILVSVAISSKISLEAIEELYSGIKLACEKYNIDLIGGDTSSSLTGLVINITAVGDAESKELIYRSGAKINDLICVSGDLGAAYMGLQLLEREKEVFKVNPNMQPDLNKYNYILERQLKPEARKDIIDLLRNNNIPLTSMIDISDGLSSEILHICNKSNTGCKIYEERIPVDYETINMSKEFKIDPTVAALSGGEDYELLFTVPVEEIENINKLQGISVLGHISDKNEGNVLITRDGSVVELIAQGWNTLQHNKD